MALYKSKQMTSPYAIQDFMGRIGNTASKQLIDQAVALGIPMSAFTGETTGGTGMANTGYNEGSSGGGGAGGGFGAPSGYGGQSFVDDFMRQLPQNFWGDYFDQSGLAAYEKRGEFGAIAEGLLATMANRDDLFPLTRNDYTQYMETSRGRADKLGGILDELRANPIDNQTWSYGGSSVSVPGPGSKTRANQELAYQQELRALDQAGLGALGGRAAYEGDYLDKGTAEWNNLAPILMAYSEAAKDPYRDLQGAYGQMMGAGIQGQESAMERELRRYGMDKQYDLGMAGIEAQRYSTDVGNEFSLAKLLAGLGGVGSLTGGVGKLLNSGVFKGLLDKSPDVAKGILNLLSDDGYEQDWWSNPAVNEGMWDPTGSVRGGGWGDWGGGAGWDDVVSMMP